MIFRKISLRRPKSASCRRRPYCCAAEELNDRGGLVLCRFLGRRDKDAIHTLGQPASEKRQGTKSREGIRVAMRRALSRTEHRTEFRFRSWVIFTGCQPRMRIQ